MADERCRCCGHPLHEQGGPNVCAYWLGQMHCPCDFYDTPTRQPSDANRPCPLNHGRVPHGEHRWIYRPGCVGYCWGTPTGG